jgi:hypothetical protein
MLEHSVLLVRRGATRAIVDGDSGAPLGFARWQTEWPGAWRIFARAVLAVHEQEDEPLLFTVRHAWSLLPRNEVRDAEGNLVGSLLGRFTYDRFGRQLAVLSGENGGVFHSPEQRPLAELTVSADGLRIAFHAEVAGQPFVKMLLLAACLVPARGS